MTPEEIKALRTRLGLTQAAFAEKLGTGKQAVNNWEKGIRKPLRVYLQLMEKLADYL